MIAWIRQGGNKSSGGYGLRPLALSLQKIAEATSGTPFFFLLQVTTSVKSPFLLDGAFYVGKTA